MDHRTRVRAALDLDLEAFLLELESRKVGTLHQVDDLLDLFEVQV